MPAPITRFMLLGLIAALLAGALFAPGLPGSFVFDDIPNIVDNPRIQLDKPDAEGLSRVLTTPQLSGFRRTLPTLSFALDYWRGGGPDPATFKTTNIVLHALAEQGLLDKGLKVRTLTLPDVFQDQDTPEKMYEAAGLDARSIAATAIKALGRGDERALKLIVG